MHYSTLVRIFLIAFIGIMSCSTQQSFTSSKEPSPDATGILMTVDKSPSETFSELISYFQQRDLELDEINRFQHYLRTEYLTLGEEMYTYRIEAVIPPADSTVVVFRSQAIGPNVQNPASISKEMGRLSSSLWERFHESVIEFPHKSIYYTSN